MRAAPLLCAAFLLAACQQEPPATPLTPEQSDALRPAAARIAGIYEQSCKSCHTVPDTGTPLAGDRTIWNPRRAKGEDRLLKNTLAGLNRIAAVGQCIACTPRSHEHTSELQLL